MKMGSYSIVWEYLKLVSDMLLIVSVWLVNQCASLVSWDWKDDTVDREDSVRQAINKVKICLMRNTLTICFFFKRLISVHILLPLQVTMVALH